MNKVSLQISLAPSDYRHSLYLLEHQINVFKDQVDEILLTYDTHKSKGHFSSNWELYNEKMWHFLYNVEKSSSKIRLVKIDYSREVNFIIANTFFKKNRIPAKDWRGGPFYTYFFGIYASSNPFVLHIDSDLFFGGLSNTWISEAIELYNNDKTILFINPLAGPPKPDGQLIGQDYRQYQNLSYHFAFKGMSTRIFFVNKNRLSEHTFSNIRTKKIEELIRALYRGNPPFILPEQFISANMAEQKRIRVDFKGKAPGLWSLHPPYRTNWFYENLPTIIRKIEQNEVPESQNGFYDIVDELVDWSEAKAKFRKI
ncbi:hypothetical protein [Pedobacter chitinilyticus]|uniref:Uncharacterized protein n=1 Tax=Pedobacter chitinilyticus TaxID=2233776 RepID=A0A3S3PZZ1_9SPHI|nr:hypothetical protein [Pedobacter chitinilyticus]RWU08609.1 hypothetical protein DPV69_09580 [Pedobacter chitinilyticus]